MSLSPARSSQRGIATNEIGIVSVILLIIGVAVINLMPEPSAPALRCLGVLASVADGTLSPDAQCPTCKIAYTVVKKDGRESVACPDPKNHLKFPPRYERPAGGAWTLVQSLPSQPPADTLEAGRKASYLRVTGPAAPVLEIRPRIYWRWFLGPLIHLFGLFYIVSLPFQFHPKSENPPGVKVMCLVAAITFSWLLWKTGLSVEGSESFHFDPSRRHVTHRRYLFGKELAPKEYDSCDGVVFVKAETGWWANYSVLLVRRTGTGRVVTEIASNLSEEDARVGTFLGAAFNSR
jgi:hypothetical protein